MLFQVQVLCVHFTNHFGSTRECYVFIFYLIVVTLKFIEVVSSVILAGRNLFILFLKIEWFRPKIYE